MTVSELSEEGVLEGEGTLFGLAVKKFTKEELEKLAKDMAEGLAKEMTKND